MRVAGGAVTTRRWLILVFAVGAALRVFPLEFGLPYLHARPDEEVATGIAVAMLGGDPNPHFFHWPSLTFYLFAGYFWLNAEVVRLLGGVPVFDAGHYVLLGRSVVAAFGASTLVLAYKIGRRVDDDVTGVLAAALLAVSILHVRDSHFAMTDVIATMWATGSLAQLLRALENRGRGEALGWFGAAGVSGGLAASTKYNAAAVVVAMGAAQILLLMRERRLRALLPSLVFGLLFVAGFVVATPYAMLDFAKFKEDVIFDVTHLSGGHGINLGRGWVYHLTHTLPFGLGPTAFLAAILGIIPFVRRNAPYAFVLGSYVFVLYITLGSGYTVFFRYILPIVPVACVVAALGVKQVAEWLGGSARALAVVIALVVGPGLVNSLWFDVLLARIDTRVLAGEWLESRLQPDDTLHDAGGNYTSLDLSRAAFHQWYFDPEKNSFGDPQGRTPDWLVLYESPLFTYTRIPWQLQTLAETRYERVHTVRASTGRRRDAVYDLQDAFFMPVWGMWTIERPGPTVHIYRLRR